MTQLGADNMEETVLEETEEIGVNSISEKLERDGHKENHLDQTPADIIDEIDEGNRLYNKVLVEASELVAENPGKTIGAGGFGGLGTGLAATGEPRWAALEAVTGGIGGALTAFSYHISSAIGRRDAEYKALRELGEYKEVKEGWRDLLKNSKNLETDLISSQHNYPDGEIAELVEHRLAREADIGETGISAVTSMGAKKYDIVFYNGGREIMSVKGEIKEDFAPNEYIETGKSLNQIAQEFAKYVDREDSFHYHGSEEN